LTYDFTQRRHHARHELQTTNIFKKSLENLVIGEIFGSLGVIFEEKLAAKFWVAKALVN